MSQEIDKKKVMKFIKKFAEDKELARKDATWFLLNYATKRMGALDRYRKSPKGKRARAKAEKRAAKKVA